MKVTHELKPYDLSEIEWRYYIIHLANLDKKLTLAMELETKISEVELTMQRDKKPLTDLGLKDAIVYLAKIRQDQFKIKNLVDCYLTNMHPRDKSASLESATSTKCQDRRASQSSTWKTDEAPMDSGRSVSKHHDRELNATLAVDFSQSSPVTR